MAKLSTEKLTIEDERGGKLRFQYDINVNKDGSFTTTLPDDIVKLFIDAGLKLKHNQLGNKGYFSDKTKDGLERQIKDTVLEYMSRDMTSERIIINYVIQTQCSYVLVKGDIVPNPGREWTGGDYLTDKDLGWREGNVDIDAAHNSPFGFQIYAKPFVRRDYKYRSGNVKTEYKPLHDGGEIATKALENGYFLRWLNSVPCISKPYSSSEKELDYTENVAEFFVNMIKSICAMNERIKDFLEPDAIKMIADKKMKFLT